MLSSFRELLNATKNVHVSHSQSQNEDKHVNINAGSDLLRYYQSNWEEIHSVNEENARQAQHLSKCIEAIERKTKLDKRNIEMMMHLLVNNLKPMMNVCMKKMDELSCYFRVVEDDLVALEDAIDELELARAKRGNLSRLEQHTQKRSEELEAQRAHLEEEHQRATRRHEQLQREHLEQRQRAFQEAFRNDLERYRVMGAVPRPAAAGDRGQGALLEEIHIDQDTGALDSFLDGVG